MDVLGYILALSPFLNFDLVEKKIPKLIQSEAKILEIFKVWLHPLTRHPYLCLNKNTTAQSILNEHFKYTFKVMYRV